MKHSTNMEFVININEPLISALLALSLTINIGLTFKFVYSKITNSNQTANGLKDSHPVQLGAGSTGNTIIQNIMNKAPEKYEEVKNEIEEKGEALQKGDLDLSEYFENFESKANGIWVGAKTGYKDIDLYLDTLKPSQLITIASLPTEGRTTLATDIARHNAIVLKLPVFMFTMGTKNQLMVDRLISAEAGVDAYKLSTGKLSTDTEFEQLQETMKRLSDAPIFIDDSLHSNTTELKQTVQKATKGKAIGLVIIDGIELLSDYQQNKTSALTNLKRMAIELDIPVIITAPFPNDPTARRGGLARLTDLPEPFSQIADVVVGLSPNNYRFDSDHNEHVKTVSILKNRDGHSGSTELYYDDRNIRFLNIDTSHPSYKSDDDF